jgi:hypothetical protein
VPKKVVHIDHLEPQQARHYSRMELRRMVRRLLSADMNSEEVKMWFVDQLPEALQYAQAQGLRRERRVRHTTTAPAATPHTEAQEGGHGQG